ncbi:hypothetical protein [Thermophilibacter sp.]
MAALTNTITTTEVVEALDIEFLKNFNGDVSRLTEILGLFGPEIVPAGTAMYTYTVTGSLNTTSVVEGDEVPLSKYEVEKTPIGEHTVKPYRKLTTAQAILKGGFENAVMRTDAQMVKDIRTDVLKSFFTYLAKGTGTATGSGLQATLAQMDAKLSDTLETNGDAADRIVHFVNPYDIADYLGNAQVTTQTVYGMNYIQSFLGVTDIFVTNKVTENTVYATPVENIHVYGVDFASLSQAALEYTTQDGGLVGVHHDANYARTSSETYALVGCDLLAENLSYIVKGTITDPSGD